MYSAFSRAILAYCLYQFETCFCGISFYKFLSVNYIIFDKNVKLGKVYLQIHLCEIFGIFQLCHCPPCPTAYKCSLHRAGVPETHNRDAKPRELGKTSKKTPVPLGIAQKEKIKTLPPHYYKSWQLFIAPVTKHHPGPSLL